MQKALCNIKNAIRILSYIKSWQWYLKHEYSIKHLDITTDGVIGGGACTVYSGE